MGVARSFRCVGCRTRFARGFDVCSSCGQENSCLAAVGPDVEDEESHENDPCQSLVDYEEAEVERIAVCEPWHSLMGPPEKPGLPLADEDGEGASILVYGRGGGGKTTLLLELAASVARTEEVVWVPAEPNQGPAALRGIANRIGFELPRSLRIVEPSSLSETCSALRARERRLVICDSVSSYAEEGIDTVRAWFSLREATPGAALICVVHITKNGRMAGAEKLRHLCHAVVYVTSRHISIPGKSRFGPPKKIARPKLK